MDKKADLMKVIGSIDAKHSWNYEQEGGFLYVYRLYFGKKVGARIPIASIETGSVTQCAKDAVMYVNNKIKNQREERKLSKGNGSSACFIPIAQPKPVQLSIQIPQELKKKIDCSAVASMCSVDNFVAQAIEFALSNMKGE